MKFERVHWPADRIARSGPTSKPRAGEPIVTLLTSDPEIISALIEGDIETKTRTAKLYQEQPRVKLWRNASDCYANFGWMRDHIHDHVLLAKSQEIPFLRTTVDKLDISIPDWLGEHPKHEYKDSVTWCMSGASEEDLDSLEQWCKDIVTLRAKSRNERSRQDKFFAKLDQSVLRWSNVDTPESLLNSLKRARHLKETLASTCVVPTETVQSVNSATQQTRADAGPSKAASDNDFDLEALLTSLKLSDDADSSGEDEGEAGALMDEWDSMKRADDSEGESD